MDKKNDVDRLTDRLRGKYEIGPNAEFGHRGFSKVIPGIQIEAANKIEEMNKILQLCFDDICRGYGKVSKKTAMKLYKYINKLST